MPIANIETSEERETVIGTSIIEKQDESDKIQADSESSNDSGRIRQVCSFLMHRICDSSTSELIIKKETNDNETDSHDERILDNKTNTNVNTCSGTTADKIKCDIVAADNNCEENNNNAEPSIIKQEPICYKIERDEIKVEEKVEIKNEVVSKSEDIFNEVSGQFSACITNFFQNCLEIL